jgi:HPt (histidine-containing phosphotransfer) domain-containing protein
MARVAGRRGVVTTEGPGPPPVDVAALVRLADELGPAHLAEVCELFLSDGYELLAAARAACDSGDADAAARAAHRLKSASGFLGAGRLCSLCAEVENLARHDRLGQVVPRVSLMIDELGRVSDDLASFVRNRRL